jgi:hypothetical protein
VKKILFGVALVLALAVGTQPKAHADYWCPSGAGAEVGIFPVGPAWVPYRYCAGFNTGEEVDFDFQMITWGDYWDLKRVLGD